MGKVRKWNKTGFAYKFLHGLPDSGAGKFLMSESALVNKSYCNFYPK